MTAEPRGPEILEAPPAGPSPDGEAETALRRCLDRRFPTAGAIHRSRFGGVTSFPLWVLTVERGPAGPVKVLLKDFGSSRLPKDDLPARRRRELLVYRELLAAADLRTAEYYGSLWDEPAGRFWLLLEFVEAVELRNLKFGDWVKAAAWLGRLHGRFARRADALQAADFLVRHDAGFFRAQAELASRAAAGFPAPWREQVAGVLRRYDAAVEVMAGQPRTLVHGSYRPQNVLVGGAAGPEARVFAVDWELAALGAPLYDFAFLADGFRGAELETLRETYRGEAASEGLLLPGSEEMARVVDCFRLHKTMKSLGDAVALKFSESVVRKLAAAAAEIGERVLS